MLTGLASLPTPAPLLCGGGGVVRPWWPGNNGQTDRTQPPPRAGPEGTRGGLACVWAAAWPCAPPLCTHRHRENGVQPWDRKPDLLDGRCKAIPGESGAQRAAQMGRLRSGEGRAGGRWLSRLGLRGEGAGEAPGFAPAQLSAVSASCVAGVCVRDRCVRGGLRSSSLEKRRGACNPHCQTPAPYQPPSFAEPQPPPTWTLLQICGSALLAGPPLPSLMGA